MKTLKVDVDAAFDTSRSVSNDAVELHEQLADLQRDWDHLASGWSGAASSAYAPLWEEWRDGAIELVDTLEELARKLAVGAAEYADQDARSAVTVASTPIKTKL